MNRKSDDLPIAKPRHSVFPIRRGMVGVSVGELLRFDNGFLFVRILQAKKLSKKLIKFHGRRLKPVNFVKQIISAIVN